MSRDRSRGPATYGEAAAHIAAVVSGVFAGTCILFISGILSLNIHPLDEPLHRALVAFAIALPTLFLSASLAFLRTAGLFAYVLLVAGGLLLEFGVYSTLLHMDAGAATVFGIVALLWTFTFMIIASVTLRHR